MRSYRRIPVKLFERSTVTVNSFATFGRPSDVTQRNERPVLCSGRACPEVRGATEEARVPPNEGGPSRSAIRRSHPRKRTPCPGRERTQFRAEADRAGEAITASARRLLRRARDGPPDAGSRGSVASMGLAAVRRQVHPCRCRGLRRHDGDQGEVLQPAVPTCGPGRDEFPASTPPSKRLWSRSAIFVRPGHRAPRPSSGGLEEERTNCKRREPDEVAPCGPDSPTAPGPLLPRGSSAEPTQRAQVALRGRDGAVATGRLDCQSRWLAARYKRAACIDLVT